MAFVYPRRGAARGRLRGPTWRTRGSVPPPAAVRMTPARPARDGWKTNGISTQQQLNDTKENAHGNEEDSIGTGNPTGNGCRDLGGRATGGYQAGQGAHEYICPRAPQLRERTTQGGSGGSS